MTRDELGEWLRLCAADGVGNLTARKLLAAFGLPQEIFSQSLGALSQVVTATQARALLNPSAKTAALADASWAWLNAEPNGPLRLIASLADPNYPRLLLTLPDPPPLIYVTGSTSVYEAWASQQEATDIAIVGSRNATPQGLANARSFAKTFALAGMNVVSGLALGIDGAAHEGALDAQREVGKAAGSTIAIVGTGLDRVYPKRHLDLAHRIAQAGLIVSEFAIGTAPVPENFPRRNRIIAALTQGSLVVEAAIHSGSLITARQALDLGKEVFAIPGSIHSPQSKGCHHLIKQGAKLVECAADVIEEIPIKPRLGIANATAFSASNSGAKPASGQASAAQAASHANPLLQALGHDPVSLDSLIDRTGIPAAQIQVQLLELELAGELARLPGGLFQRQTTA